MDEDDRAQFAAVHRRRLIDAAAAGDTDAGRAMLQHAMAAMRRAAPACDEADAVALEWAAAAIAQGLEGVALARAFGVERQRGAPSSNALSRVIFEAAPVWQEVRELRAQLAGQGVTSPQAVAVDRVAKRHGISASKVRSLLAMMNRQAEKPEAD